MRTTLDISDDVLRAAKELARREKKTAGEILSQLARSALTTLPFRKSSGKSEEFLGFRPFPNRGGLVTNELIDKLGEEDPG